jgi:3-oxoacyl-[acyl-carrier protein] reductase
MSEDNSSLALVTGGNRGIGLAIAHSLAKGGHRVVITYRSGDAPPDFLSVKMDVTSTESVESAFAEIEEKWGIPEVIVANAGITKDGLVLRMSDGDFEDVINSNLTGAFRVARRATKG